MHTIKDIARLSGVGSSTVSRVLNGGTNVAPDTLEKILKVVRELNYKPNSAARYLKRGDYSVSTVGVILPKIAHPFWFDIVREIYAHLNKINYNIMIFNIDKNDPDKVIRHVIEERLAGVLIFATQLTDQERIMLEVSNTRYIFVDIHDESHTSIYLDNRSGGALAAGYLVTRGARRIAYIGDAEGFLIQQERLAGFKEELARNDLTIAVEEYILLDSGDSYAATKKVLAQKCDGIFYFCDQIAYDGLMALVEMSAMVPVIGYDDMKPSHYLGLTTIKQPTDSIGAESAKLLLQMIKKGDKNYKSICIQPELIVRRT